MPESDSDYMIEAAPGDDARVDACLEHLGARIPGSLRTDVYQRQLYSTDASIYQVEPLAVVVPQHRDELQAVMEAAAEFEVPVVARAAGSSLAEVEQAGGWSTGSKSLRNDYSHLNMASKWEDVTI